MTDKEVEELLYKKAKEFKINKTDEELKTMFEKMTKNVLDRIEKEEKKKK